MARSPDVLIIGAGVVGVCTAYYLTQQGYRPLVVEQGEVGAGSSYGNAGLIVPSYSFPLSTPEALTHALKWLLDAESPFYIKPRLDPALIRWLFRFVTSANRATVHRTMPLLLALQRASLEEFRRLVADLALDCGFAQRGGLALFFRQEEWKAALAEAEALRQYGMSVEALDAAEVRDRVPFVRPEVVGGVMYPEDAHLIPDRFVRELARRAEEQGACIMTETEVVALEVQDRRVCWVVTTRDVLEPEQVVLAAGALSPALVRPLGLHLPIQPAKGYSITVRRPAGVPELPLHLAESKVVVTPMGEHLRFAGTLELAGVDRSINLRRVRAIQHAVRRYLNLDPEADLVELWRGLRPLTPDSLPILGRWPQVENLILATGHGMLGVSLGPITGKLAAQLAAGAPPEMDIAPLSPTRFG